MLRLESRLDLPKALAEPEVAGVEHDSQEVVRLNLHHQLSPYLFSSIVYEVSALVSERGEIWSMKKDSKAVQKFSPGRRNGERPVRTLRRLMVIAQTFWWLRSQILDAARESISLVSIHIISDLTTSALQSACQRLAREDEVVESIQFRINDG